MKREIKNILDQILDFNAYDEAVYSSKKDCFIFHEVYDVEDKSSKPLCLSENEIKKSLDWRSQNYELTKNWVESLPSDYLIVDLGCGPLTNSYLLKNYNAVYMDGGYFEGIDIVCDFTKRLPIKSSSVDAILLSNVLEHIPEPQLLLKEISRVLKKDGELLLLVPFIIKLHQTPLDFYRYTKHALQDLSNKSDLEVKEIRDVGGMLNILGNLLKLALRNEDKFFNRNLLRLQFLLYRIQKKFFGEGTLLTELPQGYALYASKKQST